jgi:hypothetical protein
MIKADKNILFKTLVNSKWGIDNFFLDEYKNELRVFFKPSNREFFFLIEQVVNERLGIYNCAASRFNYGYQQEWVEEYRIDIGAVMYHLRQWFDTDLQHYIDNQNEIDLYSEYVNGIKLTEITPIDYNEVETFTIDQKVQIKSGLIEIKNHIAYEFAANKELLLLVHSKLDYLADATDRLNKTDWKGIFISTVTSIIITLSVDKETGSRLWAMFLSILHIVPALFTHPDK